MKHLLICHAYQQRFSISDFGESSRSDLAARVTVTIARENLGLEAPWCIVYSAKYRSVNLISVLTQGLQGQ
jgi:hypothetical protein